jgi:hypothetical protein
MDADGNAWQPDGPQDACVVAGAEEQRIEPLPQAKIGSATQRGKKGKGDERAKGDIRAGAAPDVPGSPGECPTSS